MVNKIRTLFYRGGFGGGGELMTTLMIKKLIVLITLITLILPLVGCIPTSIVLVAASTAGATLGGAVIYDQRTYRTMHQDHNARSTIQYFLDHCSPLKAQSHITVSVFNNVALLVGQAKIPEIRDRAYQIVEKAPNIRRIYNEITIGFPLSPVQQVADSWITTKARIAMLGKAGLHSSNFKVVTENRVIYLLGIVSPRQAAMAADVARQTSGVEKVIEVFEYE